MTSQLLFLSVSTTISKQGNSAWHLLWRLFIRQDVFLINTVLWTMNWLWSVRRGLRPLNHSLCDKMTQGLHTSFLQNIMISCLFLFSIFMWRKIPLCYIDSVLHWHESLPTLVILPVYLGHSTSIQRIHSKLGIFPICIMLTHKFTLENYILLFAELHQLPIYRTVLIVGSFFLNENHLLGCPQKCPPLPMINNKKCNRKWPGTAITIV